MRFFVAGWEISGYVRLLRNLLMIILTYLFIFNPPFAFMPVSVLKMLYVLALPFLFIKSYAKRFYRVFQKPILYMLLLIFYSFFIKLIFSSKANFATANLFLLVESLFMAYVLARFYVRYYREKAELWLLGVLLLAAFISFYLILNVETNIYVRNSLLITTDLDNTSDLLFRSFGISDSLIFTYPVVLGLGVCIALKQAELHKWYYLVAFLLLIVIFFNARLGVVPIVLFYIYQIVKKRSLFKILAQFTLLIVLFMLIASSDLAKEYEQTIAWVTDGFTEISNLLQGEENEKTGNTDVLKTMIFFPGDIVGWLIGTGNDVFLASRHSDIGYILQLHYGGILYVLLCFLVPFSFYRLASKMNCSNPWFNFVFIGTFISCSIKGYFFFTNPATRFFFLLLFVYVLLDRQQQHCLK